VPVLVKHFYECPLTKKKRREKKRIEKIFLEPPVTLKIDIYDTFSVLLAAADVIRTLKRMVY